MSLYNITHEHTWARVNGSTMHTSIGDPFTLTLAVFTTHKHSTIGMCAYNQPPISSPSEQSLRVVITPYVHMYISAHLEVSHQNWHSCHESISASYRTTLRLVWTTAPNSSARLIVEVGSSSLDYAQAGGK